LWEIRWTGDTKKKGQSASKSEGVEEAEQRRGYEIRELKLSRR